VDGVVCGHIPHAEIREIDGISYHNCGDWVESNTALVERFDGAIELLRWNDVSSNAAAEPATQAAAAMRQAG
jgi:UDP-2,3-diacylglucosamine pyrophosphatase LpxH